MKRLVVCVLVAAACVSCGNGDAATVGSVRVARHTLDYELKAIMGNAGYVGRLQQSLPFVIKAGSEPPTPLVAQVLTNEIKAVVAKQLLSAHPYTLNDSEKADARLGAVGSAGNPQIFSSFPGLYQKELISRSSTLAQLRKALAPETPEEYYKAAKDQYARACEWDIVTKTREDADAARVRITGGESFESVARDVSIDTGSGPRGGSLGCNERDTLVPELDQAAFTLPLGAVSGPILAGESDAQVYHLVRVTSRATPPLARIKGEITAALDKLGAYRAQSEIRARLVGTKVRVAPAYGTWDTANLFVLPPADHAAVSPTPRPRPLPPSVSSPSQMNPSFQAGQQVFITESGVRPLLLTSIIDSRVTWINDSHRTVTVRFVALDHKLGPIKPGGSASYTPDAAGSIAYELVENPSVHGVVQVQWYFDPGEDPGAPNRLGADTPTPGASGANR